MTRTRHLAWAAGAALAGLSVIALTFAPPTAAQVVPPERNAVAVEAVPLYGYTIYAAGFSHPLTPRLDLTAGYVNESSGGNNSSLLDAGIRYHLTPPTSRGDVFLSGGYSNLNASASLSFGNFSASGSGYNVGAGASVRLTRAIVTYASASVLSLGSLGSVGFYDVGLQLHFAPYVSGQLGILALSSGSQIGGGPYAGLTFTFPF